MADLGEITPSIVSEIDPAAIRAHHVVDAPLGIVKVGHRVPVTIDSRLQDVIIPGRGPERNVVLDNARIAIRPDDRGRRGLDLVIAAGTFGRAIDAVRSVVGVFDATAVRGDALHRGTNCVPSCPSQEADALVCAVAPVVAIVVWRPKDIREAVVGSRDADIESATDEELVLPRDKEVSVRTIDRNSDTRPAIGALADDA